MPGDWEHFEAERKRDDHLACRAAFVDEANAELDPDDPWSGMPIPWGSSAEFKASLRRDHPGLVVAESDVVPLMGKLAWNPTDESLERPGMPIRQLLPSKSDSEEFRCRHCRDGIKRGSDLYCPKCNTSGHEYKLRRQRELAGMPEPDPPLADQESIHEVDEAETPCPSPANHQPCDEVRAEPKPTRRQLRKAKFGDPRSQPGTMTSSLITT